MSAETGVAELGGAALRATGVTAGYGGDPVIRDISVHVEPGQVVSLVGANGSGKSTLLKSLVGVIKMSAGTVTVGGRDLTGQPPENIARAGVGYVPQVDDVFAPLTVRENLEMGGYLLPSAQIRARIEEVMTIFPRLGTMAGRQAGKLSGGERKMLAMGRVLMVSPSVFLLDEPTANLAPAIARSLLQDQVRRLATGGAAVLVVEQRARAVLAISDRTYVLAGGEVRMSGSPAELSASPAFVESFLGGTVARLLRLGESLHDFVPVCLDRFAETGESTVEQPHLGRRQLRLELRPGWSHREAPNPSVLQVARDREQAALFQVPDRAVDSLLRHRQDGQQLADGDSRVAPDEVEDPVMRPPEPALGEHLIRQRGEGTVAEVQLLDSATQRGLPIWVKHLDLHPAPRT